MNGFFSPIQIPPQRGGNCGGLTQDFPSSRLQGGGKHRAGFFGRAASGGRDARHQSHTQGSRTPLSRVCTTRELLPTIFTIYIIQLYMYHLYMYIYTLLQIHVHTGRVSSAGQRLAGGTPDTSRTPRASSGCGSRAIAGARAPVQVIETIFIHMHL